MGNAFSFVSRWIATILVGAGCGGLASLSGNGSAASVLGSLLVLAGGLFVVATNLATWFRVPPVPIGRTEFAELYGPDVVRAVIVGSFGMGLAFGGLSASGQHALLAGATGLAILGLTNEPSRPVGAAAAESGERPTSVSQLGKDPEAKADPILDDRVAEPGMGLHDILAPADALARHARHPVVRPQDDAPRILRFEGQLRELDPGAEEPEEVRRDLFEVAPRRVVERTKQHRETA